MDYSQISTVIIAVAISIAGVRIRLNDTVERPSPEELGRDHDEDDVVF